jgi:hypothetical protein
MVAEGEEMTKISLRSPRKRSGNNSYDNTVRKRAR